MFYHGLWDMNEFYDLESDPIEKFNLIDSPSHQVIKDEMKERHFDLLEADDATDVSFKRPRFNQQDERKRH
jgi:N-acetylglucosamine-6-sulfatase